MSNFVKLIVNLQYKTCENCNFPLNSIYFVINAPLQKLDQNFLPGRDQGKKVGFFSRNNIQTIYKFRGDI